jgi:hypothetical protein
MENTQKLSEDMLATMLDKVQTLGHQAGRFEEMAGMLQQLTGVRAQLLDAVKLMNVDTPRPQVGTEVHAQLRKAIDTLKALKALKADLPKPQMDSQASDHHAYTIMSLLGLAAFIAVLCLISRRLNQGVAFALVLVFSQAVLFNILADQA